jgi:hypothetical protein
MAYAVDAFPSHEPFELAALAAGHAAVSLFHDAQLLGGAEVSARALRNCFEGSPA